MGSSPQVTGDVPGIPAPSGAAAWSILAYVVQGFVGLVTVPLVALRLDPDAQGYYYASLALIAFLPLSQFGVTYALMQSASHRAAGLRWAADGLHGEREQLGYLGTLLHTAVRWNVIATLTGASLLAVAGTAVLRATGTTPSLLLWQWAALLACAAAWQLLTPRVALLEGTGRVRDVWRFRLAQEAVAGVVLVGGLWSGLGLFSPAASLAARVIHGGAWLAGSDKSLSRIQLADTASAVRHWRGDVWPFQWRVGVSVLSGFLIYYLFTPVLLAAQGAAAAGRFGMTLAIAGGLQNATTAWVNSQAPDYGALIAARRFSALDQSFGRTFRKSTLLVVAGSLALIAADLALTRYAPAAAQRLLPPLPFALLMAAAVVNHIVFACAIYLRAHRRDPLLIPTVVGAVVTPAGVIWAAQSGSLTPVATVYFALTVLGLAATLAIFMTLRRRWHLPGR